MKQLTRKAAKSWRLVLPLVLVAIITGCNEEPGLVGADLISNQDNFTFDTVFVSDIKQVESKAYTGRLANAPVGFYSDALYGDIAARTLFKPDITLRPSLPNIDLQAEITLTLAFDSTNVYGETSSVNEFSLIPVGNTWRGREFFNNTTLFFNSAFSFADFTRSDQDSVNIEIPVLKVQELARFYNETSQERDSLFRTDFRGYLVSPKENLANKISYIDVSESSFKVRNPTDSVDTILPIGDWAYTIERTNQPPIPPGRLVIHSTNELLINTSFFEQLREYENKNILKAELLLYEDTEALNTTIGPGETRGRQPVLESHFGTRLDKPFDFTFGTGDSLGRKRDDENVYRFNITRYVNQFLFAEPESEEFYISIDAEDGILSSTTVFGPSADEAKRPKILLTIIEE